MKKIFAFAVSINDAESGNFFICDSRRKKCASYINQKSALLSLAAEKALRFGLKRLGLSEKTPYLYTESGAPSFENEKMFLSFSHSKDFAVCALSEAEIGIDIEKKREVSNALIRKVLSDNEKSEDFFRLWTAKESYLKMKKTGIVTNLKNLLVSDSHIHDTRTDGESFLSYIEYEDYVICICSNEPCEIIFERISD